jgi:hypothetical protein
MDFPEILNNVTTLIMENDYTDINEKMYVDKVLKENGFYVDYSKEGGGMDGPCYKFFYQVWKK